MKKKKSTNQRNKSPPNIEATPWPNLPQRLIKHIAKHPNALQSINFGVATKSWEHSSPHCRLNSDQAQPRLLVSDRFDAPALPQYCGIEFPLGDYYWYWYIQKWRRPPLYVWTHFLGCSHGLIFSRPAAAVAASSTAPRRFNLFRPRELWTGVSWPGWEDGFPFACAALSSAYAYGGGSCVLMVATGVSSPAFMFCRLNDGRREWIEKDCEISEPDQRRSKRNGEDKFMTFTNLLGFEGKFYALSSQGTLAVIEKIDQDRFEIVALGKTRAVPSVPARGFQECLIESDGEILLVFLVHGKCSNAVDGIEVYRLRFDDLSWVRMESLGKQRTLFVGNDCCVSVRAEKVGCRGNRVYFTRRRGGGCGGGGDWWELDMECGRISRPDWAERGSVNGNCMEWDKPIICNEDVQDS